MPKGRARVTTRTIRIENRQNSKWFLKTLSGITGHPSHNMYTHYSIPHTRYSLTHLPTHTRHSPTHSHHSLTHSPTHSLTHPLTHSPWRVWDPPVSQSFLVQCISSEHRICHLLQEMGETRINLCINRWVWYSLVWISCFLFHGLQSYFSILLPGGPIGSVGN